MKNIILVLLLLVFIGCTSTKKSFETINESLRTEFISKVDSIRLLVKENERLLSENKQLTEFGVTFNKPCPEIPPVTIPVTCDADSLKAALIQANNLINYLNVMNKTLNNKVEILADGTMKAEGNIKSLNLTKERYSLSLREKQKAIDSLTKEVEGLRKTEVVKDNTSQSSSKTKLSFPWWLILIGIVIGFIIRPYVTNLFFIIKNKLS